MLLVLNEPSLTALQMTEHWNVFTTSDIFLGLLGAVGFLSMIVVIVTASGRVDKREKTISEYRQLQNLEPEEDVLSDD